MADTSRVTPEWSRGKSRASRAQERDSSSRSVNLQVYPPVADLLSDYYNSRQQLTLAVFLLKELL
jgi:hypothetical protein